MVFWMEKQNKKTTTLFNKNKIKRCMSSHHLSLGHSTIKYLTFDPNPKFFNNGLFRGSNFLRNIKLCPILALDLRWS